MWLKKKFPAIKKNYVFDYIINEDLRRGKYQGVFYICSILLCIDLVQERQYVVGGSQSNNNHKIFSRLLHIYMASHERVCISNVLGFQKVMFLVLISITVQWLYAILFISIISGWW